MRGDVELGGPIVQKYSAQRIALGAVLVPGELDSDGEAVTAEKIEAVAHGFMQSYRNVDVQHTLQNVGQVVESYISPVEQEVVAYGEKVILPKGTWILGTKLSEDAWAQVEAGSLQGYSIMGIRASHFAQVSKAEYDGGYCCKRTLLSDLGPEWVVAFVSVVDAPAVPKALFFSLKSKEKEDHDAQVETPSFFAKIGRAFGFTSSDKVGRRFSDTTYNAMLTAQESLAALLAEADAERISKAEGDDEMTIEEMQEAIKAAVADATAPLLERITVLETAKKAEPVIEPVAEKTAEELEAEAAEKLEAEAAEALEAEANKAAEDAFKAAFDERLTALETKVKRSVGSKSLPNDGAVEKAEPVTELYPRNAMGQRV